MEEFVACFSEVSDPRQENVRRNLHEVLMIALCTMLCGGEDCTDMEVFGRAKRPFLRQFLRLKHGIPSHDTFSRRASGQSALHMVHAWAVDQRLLLGQIATDAKSNEITAVPKLLAMLSLKGCIMTADAMSCQRAICDEPAIGKPPQ